jgi:hypothetical protein
MIVQMYKRDMFYQIQGRMGLEKNLFHDKIGLYITFLLPRVWKMSIVDARSSFRKKNVK